MISRKFFLLFFTKNQTNGRYFVSFSQCIRHFTRTLGLSQSYKIIFERRFHEISKLKDLHHYALFWQSILARFSQEKARFSTANDLTSFQVCAFIYIRSNFTTFDAISWFHLLWLKRWPVCFGQILISKPASCLLSSYLDVSKVGPMVKKKLCYCHWTHRFNG